MHRERYIQMEKVSGRRGGVWRGGVRSGGVRRGGVRRGGVWRRGEGVLRYRL